MKMEKSREKWKRGDGGFLLSGLTRLGKELAGMEGNGKEQQNLSSFSGGANINYADYIDYYAD